MKVLIGVDGSRCSNAAIEFVRRMPLRAGTRILLVSSVPFPVVAYSEMVVPAATAIEMSLAEEMERHEDLVARAERELRNSGLATETRVLQGDPRDQLVQVAHDERVNLIVVGSHGRTGLAKLLMGSVASHVVTHAPCSVLVVKEEQS